MSASVPLRGLLRGRGSTTMGYTKYTALPTFISKLRRPNFGLTGLANRVYLARGICIN